MMKKLALGALTALVLGAGIAAAPAALAAPPDPAAPNGIELQGPSMCTDPIDCPSPDNCDRAGMDYDPSVPVCLARQRPEEVIGGARCDDPAQVVIAVRPDGSYVCGVAAGDTDSHAGTPQVPSAPTQAAPGKAPVAPAPAVAVGTGSRAPHGVSGSAALAQLRDFLVEFLLRTFGMSH